MAKNAKRQVFAGKLSRRSARRLTGPPPRNEGREFVKETPTAKFYAIGFCVLCVDVTCELMASLLLGSREGSQLANLMLAGGGIRCSAN